MMAQNAGGSSIQEEVTVTVNNIAINGENFSLRGLDAHFPYPIMSSISILDADGNPVLGLADTLRWLTPNDLAQIGLPVSQIWQPLLEYHLEDPTFPADQDVYNQIPAPLITEVRETTRLPTSTMLVMDVSSSMSEEIDLVKLAAETFIDLLRPVDQAGIIQFADTIKAFQPMTGDKERLKEVIAATQLGNGTGLRDAIFFGIQQTRNAPGRKGLIVYTDGRDNLSSVGPTSIINAARLFNIPLFTIALGDETSEDQLERMANETGGLFFKVANAEDMAFIYRKLTDLIRNFYLLAHTTTDPNQNGTWRVVDISINTPDLQGRGLGNYFVEDVPPPATTDLALTLSSITDTTTVIDSDTLPAVRPGEDYVYRLTINNLRDNPADSIWLLQTLPDSVKFVSASLQPEFRRDNLVIWQVPRVQANDSVVVRLAVRTVSDLPDSVQMFVSTAEMSAGNDDTPENNFAADTVYLFTEPPPPPNYDLQLAQFVDTDTTIQLAGETVPAVLAGDSYSYRLLLRNLGPGAANSITVEDTFPDSTTISGFNLPPHLQEAGRAVWQFDALAAGAELELTFAATVSDSLADSPMQLVNISRVAAALDTNAANDSAATSVYAVNRPPPPTRNYDLALTQTAETDTTIVIDGEPVAGVLAGARYRYNVSVRNNGPARASNVTLTDIFPQATILSNFSLEPSARETDRYVWQFDTLKAGAQIDMSFDATVSDSLATSPLELINLTRVAAARDTNAANDSATTSVFAISDEIVPSDQVDLAIFQRVVTDSLTVAGGDTIWYARAGETYSYLLQLQNLGADNAREVTVVDSLPANLTLSNMRVTPTSIENGVLHWDLGFVSAGKSVDLSFDVTVALDMPEGLNLLINEVRAQAANEPLDELGNNVVRDTVFNLVRPPLAPAPLIEAMPAVVEVGDSVTVRVQVRAPIAAWDVRVLLADGSIDSTYADAFIARTDLPPNQWVELVPKFGNTRLFTNAEQEELVFELLTLDNFDRAQSARSSVLVQSNNNMVLERNVFAASREPSLAIRFKLSSNRVARIDLFDLAGSHITKLVEQPFNAGWNQFSWDGATASGEKVGSGVYMVTLRSGAFTDIKKIMVVR